MSASSFRRAFAPIAAAVLLAPSISFAQSPVDETWSFRLGAFFPNIDTKARADGTGGRVGTSIDFESDLGLSSSKTLPIFDATWRVAPNHRVEFGYLDLSRTGSTTLTANIEWQGETFSRSTQVRGEFDSQIIAATYLYSFYRTPATELSAGIGVFYTKLEAGISNEGPLSIDRSVTANAPLPVIALRAEQRFAEQWKGELRYQWFGIKAGDYDGSLNVFNGAVAYYPWKNWGVEAGYNYSRYDLKVSRDAWRGEAKYQFHGPVVSLVGRF
jgi:hypothetical protein